MRCAALLIGLVSYTTAYKLSPRPLTPRPLTPRRSSAAGAAAALGTSLPALAVSDWWVEVNKPPIELAPFKINPVGWTFFAGYGAYLAWQLFRPESEAEQRRAAKQEEEGRASAAAAEPFLKAAAEAPGATVTASGLVYEELAPGEGATPLPENKVKVHYTGTLADGTVFDCSRTRGEPAEFKLNQVIKGWQEGVGMMKPGGRAKLTIPSYLAYGAMATGGIPANSALCFDVELLEVKEDEGFSLPWQ